MSVVCCMNFYMGLVVVKYCWWMTLFSVILAHVAACIIHMPQPHKGCRDMPVVSLQLSISTITSVSINLSQNIWQNIDWKKVEYIKIMKGLPHILKIYWEKEYSKGIDLWMDCPSKAKILKRCFEFLYLKGPWSCSLSKFVLFYLLSKYKVFSDFERIGSLKIAGKNFRSWSC